MEIRNVPGRGLAWETLKSGHKLAFMFPGVGSEYTGMGKHVFDSFACAREVFEQASFFAGQDLAKLCFDPEQADRLKDLVNAKLAVVTTSVASSRVLIEEFGIEPDYCVGHSVGEYSALCSAGILNLGDTVKALQHRAAFITALLAEAPGTMAWAINLPSERVEEIAVSLQGAGQQVYVSAFDCPDQTSISCTKEAFSSCAAAIEDAGGILVPINASGPFHSPLMQEASDRFREILATCDFGEANYAVLANCDAQPYPDTAEGIIENLAQHIVKPVQWRRTVAYLQEKQVRHAIELGPKNILAFLLKKIAQDISTVSLDREENWTSFQSDWLIDEDGVIQAISGCLGAIASTRNGCRDPEIYKTDVIEPVNVLKALHGDLSSGKTPISKSHLTAAIEITNSALLAKQLPMPEVAKRLSQILGSHFINIHFR